MRIRLAVLWLPAVVLAVGAAAVVTWADRSAEPGGPPPEAATVDSDVPVPTPIIVNEPDGPSGGPAEVSLPPAPKRASLSPMMQEILDAWDAHAALVAALERRIEASTDVGEALLLQQKIETLRRQVEIDILGIQAHHARLAGRHEQAAEIEAAIALMTAPPPVVKPVERRPADGRGE